MELRAMVGVLVLQPGKKKVKKEKKRKEKKTGKKEIKIKHYSSIGERKKQENQNWAVSQEKEAKDHPYFPRLPSLSSLPPGTQQACWGEGSDDIWFWETHNKGKWEKERGGERGLGNWTDRGFFFVPFATPTLLSPLSLQVLATNKKEKRKNKKEKRKKKKERKVGLFLIIVLFKVR